MRVLVIEDEEKISNFVRKGLETQGCAVTVVDNGDDAISNEEMLNESGRMFDKSDKNRDKKVDNADETRGAPNSNQPPRQGGNRFDELDRDGKVSFSEYHAREKSRKDNVDEARMRERFSQFDKDRNGSLSNNELETAPRGRGRRQ